ncbi:MAG: hypothetical protein F6J97_05525 [Leptolyngbya sp. SIO4C1]|nr:hypothetical protein [Leptolyngbya sp. SIO4C1]
MLTALTNAVAQPWTGLYLRFLAVVLAYGAAMHVGNILGWSGKPWLTTPLLWRVMDVVLLLFNAIAAVGLWYRQAWAVAAFVVGLVALQIVPYTVFRQQFIEAPEQAQVLNGLVGTELALLLVLGLLLVAKK